MEKGSNKPMKIVVDNDGVAIYMVGNDLVSDLTKVLIDGMQYNVRTQSLPKPSTIGFQTCYFIREPTFGVEVDLYCVSLKKEIYPLEYELGD